MHVALTFSRSNFKTLCQGNFSSLIEDLSSSQKLKCPHNRVLLAIKWKVVLRGKNKEGDGTPGSREVRQEKITGFTRGIAYTNRISDRRQKPAPRSRAHAQRGARSPPPRRVRPSTPVPAVASPHHRRDRHPVLRWASRGEATQLFPSSPHPWPLAVEPMGPLAQPPAHLPRSGTGTAVPDAPPGRSGADLTLNCTSVGGDVGSSDPLRESRRSSRAA